MTTSAQTPPRRGSGHRERLLAAAVDCLRERGYARTTARDLVAASGTNLASIGYHFGSKEALLNEAIAEGFSAWTAAVEVAIEADEARPLRDRIDASLRATIGRFAELRPFLLAFVEAFPQAVRSPELRDRMADAYEDVREATAAMVEDALATEGVGLPTPERRALASVLVAVCDGFLLQWLVDPDRTPEAVELEAMVAGVARLLGE